MQLSLPNLLICACFRTSHESLFSTSPGQSAVLLVLFHCADIEYVIGDGKANISPTNFGVPRSRCQLEPVRNVCEKAGPPIKMPENAWSDFGSFGFSTKSTLSRFVRDDDSALRWIGNTIVPVSPERGECGENPRAGQAAICQNVSVQNRELFLCGDKVAIHMHSPGAANSSGSCVSVTRTGRDRRLRTRARDPCARASSKEFIDAYIAHHSSQMAAAACPGWAPGTSGWCW